MAKSDLVKSLLKGIDIIEIIAKSENGLRLNEIAEHLEITAPSAHSLVKTLMSRGVIKKTQSNLHELGPRLFELVDEKRSSSWLQTCESILKNLTGHMPLATLTISIQQEDELLTALRISPDRPGIMQHPNRPLNLYASASGILLLALAEEDALELIKSRYPFYEYGAHIWQTPAKLKTYLAEVKKQGYVIRNFEDQDYFPVAIPIQDTKGQLKAILGASVRNQKLFDKLCNEDLNKLLEAAKQL